ncbi:MAG: ABC transporter permease [Sulfobacillus sp.]
MSAHPLPEHEAQPIGWLGMVRASCAAAWLEYKGLRFYPSNLWLAAVQELTVVGVWYFVAQFLSPVANGVVHGSYVAYVLIGVLLNQVALAALRSPFTTISEAFWDKRLETYRLAAKGIWANVVGRLAWQVLFSTVLQALVGAALVTSGGLTLGHTIAWPVAVLIWFFLVAANAGLGLIGASLFFLLEVKNGQDPVTWAYQYLVQLVSGLYVPLVVLPGWLRALGQALPQTYAFSAMRLLVLSGAGPQTVAGSLEGLAGGGVAALIAGLVMMRWALVRAERMSGLGVVV